MPSVAFTPPTLRVAAPTYAGDMAPLFAAAKCFRVWDCPLPVPGHEPAESGDVKPRDLAAAEGNGLARVRQLKDLGVKVLLVSGIHATQRSMLETAGCQVISGITGPVNEAFRRWLRGDWASEQSDEVQPSIEPLPVRQFPSREEARVWAQRLLAHHGWTVWPVGDVDAGPVDLVARHACPVCGKRVQVAVCCGEHAWRVEDEVSEFHRLTSVGYNARLYVHPSEPGTCRVCEAYGVEVLDPFRADELDGGPLPPLRGPVSGHVNLSTNSITDGSPPEPPSTEDRS